MLELSAKRPDKFQLTNPTPHEVMAIYTQTQYAALAAAIATGALVVKYADKEVTYRSLNEMKTLLNDMAIDLGLSTNKGKRRIADFTR